MWLSGNGEMIWVFSIDCFCSLLEVVDQKIVVNLGMVIKLIWWFDILLKCEWFLYVSFGQKIVLKFYRGDNVVVVYLGCIQFLVILYYYYYFLSFEVIQLKLVRSFGIIFLCLFWIIYSDFFNILKGFQWL